MPHYVCLEVYGIAPCVLILAPSAESAGVSAGLQLEASWGSRQECGQLQTSGLPLLSPSTFEAEVGGLRVQGQHRL